MTLEQANATFGPVVHSSKTFELRVIEKDGDLHAYAFRKDAEGATELPRGFILGSNSLHFKKRA